MTEDVLWIHVYLTERRLHERGMAPVSGGREKRYTGNHEVARLADRDAVKECERRNVQVCWIPRRSKAAKIVRCYAAGAGALALTKAAMISDSIRPVMTVAIAPVSAFTSGVCIGAMASSCA